jgi:signal transduction histidine kinase
VYFDSEVITTVLNNLLSNAIKYTEKGSITIQAVTDGDDRFDISVADTGYGIAADALPHIFDRYYQAKGSHQASGTGIGLALVKSLADLHEAALSVNSHEGKGSTFTLSLAVHNSYPNALHKEDRDTEKAVEKDGKTETPADDEQEKAGLLPLLLVV